MPSEAEWTVLTDYLGGESIAGDKLKEAGTTHWGSPISGADNSSGFTALPNGGRSVSGVFNHRMYDGYWWSATEYGAASTWTNSLIFYYSSVHRIDYDKSYGFSVRCVRYYII